ncbi:MAG: FAD-dependent oxidoreductase [Candidatus Bathyarchaeia archaeon]
MPLFLSSEAEVVVSGGGPAGFVAALSSARNGARTVLVERYGFLGGMATAAGVGPFMPFFDRKGKKVVGGIADEVVERLVEAGGAVGHSPIFTPFDPEVLKYVALEMLLEANVELRLHSYVTDVIMKNNKVLGIVTEGKSGKEVLMARIFVDATGDADVATRAGAPYQVGRPQDGLTQPPSLFLRVGKVDTERLIEYAEAHPEDMGWDGKLHFAEIDRPIPQGKGFTKCHFMGAFYAKTIPKAKEAGEVLLGKDWVTTFTDLREGEVILNATRATGGVNCLDVRALTWAEIDCRRQAMSLFSFLKRRCQGYENSYLLSTGAQVGVRESRRIIGDYMITVEDVVEERDFPDAIARCAYGIDVHDPLGGGALSSPEGGIGPKHGGSYGIPYRSLLPKRIENLLVAGRPISTDFWAHGSIRVMPYCMAIGQAAGAAAALSMRHGVLPRSLDSEELRKLLKRQGAIL